MKTHIPLLLILLAGAGTALAGQPLNAGLGDLMLPQDGVSMRASSSDTDPEGNRDWAVIEPGETLILADLEGPGVITHLWNTIDSEEPFYARLLLLRMYWDDEPHPSVEAPLGDFFGVGHGLDRNLNSLPVRVSSEGRARNCYWRMPFRKSARITVTNQGNLPVKKFYYYVDWIKQRDLPRNTPYFHAMYRQEHPASTDSRYLIADIAGPGHYIGTVLNVRARHDQWFGEGDDFFFIDGGTVPALRGTGTEDYFCDAWGFREGDGPFYGAAQVQIYEGGRNSVYRWHITDPLVFRESLRFEIEHTGPKEDESYAIRDDYISSAAFWYQKEPHKPWPEIPAGYERLYYKGVVENVLDMATPIEQKTDRLQNILEKEAVAIDPILLDKPVFEGGEARIFVRNRAGIPARVSGVVQPAGALQLKPAAFHLDLKAHEERWMDLGISPLDGSLPAREVAPVVTVWSFTYAPEFNPPTTLSTLKSVIIDAPFAIPRRNAPVTVDGKLDDWAEMPFNAERPAQVRIAPDSWEGREDLSFRFAVAEDSDFLYLAIQTTDDIPLTKPGRAPWFQDGIEVRVDARPDPERSHWNQIGEEFDKFIFIAMLPADNPEETIIYDRNRLQRGIKAVCVRTETGHNSEIAIPHTVLDAFRGAKWDALRINIAIDDFDLPAGPLAQYWWRPDWRYDLNYPGSGTFLRQK
jgi:hypothetical protein